MQSKFVSQAEVGNSLALLSNRKEASVGKYSKQPEAEIRQKNLGIVCWQMEVWNMLYYISFLTIEVTELEN